MAMKWLVAMAMMAWSLLAQADGDVPTRFLNRDSVIYTRHNMTQNQDGSGNASGLPMAPHRNDYGEVCVYCHTPHGANSTFAGPLWNRTMKNPVYTNYNSMTLVGEISTPGVNSLTCLSCHDGVTAIDSVINMPGPGGYLRQQELTQNDEFLNTWNNASGPDATLHQSLLGGSAQGSERSCLSCHSPFAGTQGLGATDFTAVALGTDLSNDHPVGVPYRDPYVYPGVDYRAADATSKNMRFFDTNGNGRADPDEVRFYDTGTGYKVECASCHDPHGVPSRGKTGLFNRTFLRVTNDRSQLCLTCHVK